MLIYYGHTVPIVQKIRRLYHGGFSEEATIMKKKNLLLLAPVALSAALFLGYRTWDDLRTDNTPPEISVTGESVQVSVSAPKSALLQGITAQDDRDGDVTDSLLVEKITMLDGDGNLEVSFAAFDQSGNVSKGKRTARYTDYQAPRFYLNQPLLFVYNSNFNLMNAIGATDPLDGDIQHRIRANSQDDSTISTLGDHEVEFRVTNSMGHTVRMALPVTVYSADSYGLNLELTEYMTYLKAGSSFDAESYLAAISRGMNTVTVEGTLPAGYSLRTSGEVNTRIPGIYPVDYTVTYVQETAGGTQYISGISRLIVVVEG